MIYDTIIIGAGPAGLTAALYAGRYRMTALVLEKVAPGGQIILSTSIENFPGFPGGILTRELIEKFKKQVEGLDIEIREEEAIGLGEVSKTGESIFQIKSKENSYQAKTIIVASGAHYRKLGVKGEDSLIGRGVSYCGTCDGPLFKNKDIVVVGAGDRAIEEAILLSGYARTVNVIHRRQSLRASGILQEKAKSNPGIKFILDSVVEEIVGKDKVEAVRLKDLKTNAFKLLPVQGVFVFVGISPDTDFLKNEVAMDEKGFIVTDEDMQTSRRAVFACGDCRKKSLYQVINACAEGAVAAYNCQRYLL